ncbi:DUF883 domain-containing protein [Propionivibrio sp.]|uniref:DUF883 family protein n=1 Tax=Propionivibrio sp. TaxID=2212460 RepID=UPI002610FC33|nr:DUF883 domain-containing protein [Propionivibrio sp.]
MTNTFATNTGIVQPTGETLVADLKTIVGDADTLLKEMASYTAEEFAVARKHIEGKLAEARTRIDDARIVLTRKACDAANATNEYISENPWKVVGIASLAGLAAALLIFRRSCSQSQSRSG